MSATSLSMMSTWSKRCTKFIQSLGTMLLLLVCVLFSSFHVQPYCTSIARNLYSFFRDLYQDAILLEASVVWFLASFASVFNSLHGLYFSLLIGVVCNFAFCLMPHD